MLIGRVLPCANLASRWCVSFVWFRWRNVLWSFEAYFSPWPHINFTGSEVIFEMNQLNWRAIRRHNSNYPSFYLIIKKILMLSFYTFLSNIQFSSCGFSSFENFCHFSIFGLNFDWWSVLNSQIDGLLNLRVCKIDLSFHFSHMFDLSFVLIVAHDCLDIFFIFS